MSVWSRLTYIPLIALAVVTIILTFDFWSSFGGHVALAFQIVGVSFVLIELTGLVIYADLIARGERLKSRWWLFALAGVILVNLFADYGAVVTRTAADANDRARARAQYESSITSEFEASAAITRLERELEQMHRNRPLAALEAEYTALRQRRTWYEERDRAAPRRLLSEVAQAESALATGRALDGAVAQRDRARRTIAEFGAPPEREHPQFEALAAMLSSLGLAVSAGTVRVWLALPIAIVLKLLQLLGFWVLSHQRAGEAKGAPEVPDSVIEIMRTDDPPTPKVAQLGDAAALQDALGAFEALSGRTRG